MAFADNSSANPDWYALSSEMLHNAIERLSERSRQRQYAEHGLSSEFVNRVRHPDIVAALCERAMDSLADDYVENLEQFQLQSDYVKALEHLENAEVIWRSEAAIIQQFDDSGTEIAFLSQMRDQALRVLENRLEEVVSIHEDKASPERVALVVGIAAVMDQVFSERGEPINSPHRYRMRQVVRHLL